MEALALAAMAVTASHRRLQVHLLHEQEAVVLAGRGQPVVVLGEAGLVQLVVVAAQEEREPPTLGVEEGGQGILHLLVERVALALLFYDLVRNFLIPQ